mgnify:CR=1 FL=1
MWLSFQEQVIQRWQQIGVPAAVFTFFVLITLWIRRSAYRVLERWGQRVPWAGYPALLEGTRRISLLWCFLFAAFLALEVSALPGTGKSLAGKGIASLFILSLAVMAVRVSVGLAHFYLERLRVPLTAVVWTSRTVQISIGVVAVLVVLGLWGLPVTPIVVAIALSLLGAIVVFRDLAPNLLAGLELAASRHIRLGDYIRLQSGEEGYVVHMTGRHIHLRGLDGSLILLPNSRVVSSTVINYGRPLKKAKEPLQFYTRLHLKELTGLKAKNLAELTVLLKRVPQEVVYFHTHHFLEEHHYLTPEPPNDFAIWVSDTLGDEVLGEQLASVDTFEFPSLEALRERLVGILEGHQAEHPNQREVPEGSEFHFIKSVSFILPTPYVAHDLREFAEALKRVSLGSLY